MASNTEVCVCVFTCVYVCDLAISAEKPGTSHDEHDTYVYRQRQPRLDITYDVLLRVSVLSLATRPNYSRFAQIKC